MAHLVFYLPVLSFPLFILSFLTSATQYTINSVLVHLLCLNLFVTFEQGSQLYVVLCLFWFRYNLVKRHSLQWAISFAYLPHGHLSESTLRKGRIIKMGVISVIWGKVFTCLIADAWNALSRAGGGESSYPCYRQVLKYKFPESDNT